MTATFSKRVALAATAMGIVLSTPAFAQDDTAAAASDEDTGAIVVTARRVEERAQDVPISMSVFSPQQLADRNIVSTTDLAAYTPSLQVNSKYGPDKASFIIRGFSQDQNTAPTVAVYFADVVAPRLQSNIGGGNGAGPGSMFDLASVQVLKGPQGTLFGRNTTGGAILLVPQKPTDRLEGYVEGTYGNYDERRIQAVVNIPLADTFKVRLGVDRNLRDGYLHNRTNIGPDDFNNVNYTAARLSILAELTPDLENYTVATYTHSDTHGGLPKFVYCNNSDAGLSASARLLRAGACAQVARQAGYGYYDVENNDPEPFVRSKTWQVINTTTWKASDTLTVKNIVSYGEANESYSFSLDGDNTLIPFVIVRPGPHTPQGSESTFTEEFQLQGRTGNDRLTWQLGGYTEISNPLGGQEQYTQSFASCADTAAAYAFACSSPGLSVGLPGSISIARNTYEYRNYAVYGQATYKLTDQLNLTAGARQTWDTTRQFADNIRVGLPTTAGGALTYSCSRTVTTAPRNASLLTNGACFRTDANGNPFASKSSKPTWLINLDYKPVNDVMVYAKYARGYRAGGVNEANVGTEVWRPEKVDDYEIGVKTTFRGTVSGTFNIAGFWNNFRDQQTTVSIPQCVIGTNPGCTIGAATGISGIQNVGKSRMRGVEVDGSLFYGDFRLDFGYSYLEAKVLGATAPACDVTRYNCAAAAFLSAGSTLPYSPKNRVTLTGTYTLPIDESVGKISISATYTHTDKQFTTGADRAAFLAGRIPFDAGISPSTDLVNLAFNWRDVFGKPIDISAFATNLTNQKYFVASANGYTTLQGEAVALGEPRMYGVRLKFRFGD